MLPELDNHQLHTVAAACGYQSYNVHKLLKMGNKQIKGILARDNIGWQNEFEDAVKDTGCGVMWKDQISDFWEIKNMLRHLITNQGYFDFYNIARSFSNFHGRIVDFATRDDYPEKMLEWKKRNPAWFYDSFDEYSNDSQKAFIAFLVEDFNSIPEKERIHINQFVTYNKKQAWIKMQSLIQIL